MLATFKQNKKDQYRNFGKEDAASKICLRIKF
ncbi:hypothetical protein BDL97_14G104700 [Sphagnum fallax]|nr:hypothetical protein BDL97_14G104700 [Sphagnum fallax]